MSRPRIKESDRMDVLVQTVITKRDKARILALLGKKHLAAWVRDAVRMKLRAEEK